MKKYIKQTAILLSLLLAFSLALSSCVGGAWSDKFKITTVTQPSTTDKITETDLPGIDALPEEEIGSGSELAKFPLISLIFQQYSLRGFDYDEAMVQALKAFVAASGDIYAQYYTEEEWQAIITEYNGAMYGIGVNVIYDYSDDSIELIYVNPNTPAEKAGLKVGMKITHIGNGKDRVSIASMAEGKIEELKELYKDEELKTAASYYAYQEAIAMIKGPEGTQALFATTDAEGNIKDYSVTRGKVEVVSVRHRVSTTDSSIGIVLITEFDRLTPVQFKKSMDALISQGVDKFVFDLRGNAGGDLESICAILSTLLNKGDLMISTKDSSGVEVKRYVQEKIHSDDGSSIDYSGCNVTSADIGKYRGYKMTVLVNGSTASAAELFTANMRDYKLAQIVGVKTYGKGSVQNTIPLSSLYGEGYTGAIKLTTKLYFPPCGEGYDGGIGIEPDYKVELDKSVEGIHLFKLTEQTDNQLKTAIELLIK